MSNVSTNQFPSMNMNYANLNPATVPVNTPGESSPSTESINKFLKDSAPAQKENLVTVSKESLEKLFAIFEFAVKAMRSILLGMGVFPKSSSELDTQPHINPNAEGKVVKDAVTQQVKPAKSDVASSQDGKVDVDVGGQPKTELQTDSKAQQKVGPQVKILSDERTQVTVAPDGKLNAQQSTTSLNDVAQQNKVSSDINVTVHVQGCHCPHTDERTTPQPSVTPKVDMQPLPRPSVTPKDDTQPLPQPSVTPKVETQTTPQPQVPPVTIKSSDAKPPVLPEVPSPPTSDLTSPAPDDLEDDLRSPSQARFDSRMAVRHGLRQRF
ncbi:hypothetical protein LVW35_19070 [Pseudomonas sp. HN11]|uniref:hypothetical protein n=1 Tax=Pseudomonas sp. HN11 TaxID=1344094 RepID=UPI001F390AEE|nr:hypothetical protein [Pseudomonas sp. HN11]UII69765.1 hypothetical protein LVW35_19070 [Pseudomonas sp. HN11]